MQHYRRRADEQDRDLDRDILLEKLKRQEELRKQYGRGSWPVETMAGTMV